MTIIIDRKYNRAKFDSGSSKRNENITLNDTEQCWKWNISMKTELTGMYEPLEFEMEIKILNNIPKLGNDFCDYCVIFDSKETGTVSNRTALITGCEGNQCKSNLTLVGKLIDEPYVMGTTKSIAIQYEISNSGENAYLTQLMISIPKNVIQFEKIPLNCKLSNEKSLMICSIIDGKPVKQNEIYTLNIQLDMSQIQGTSLKVNASVTCAGINSNKINNTIENEIKLSYFSIIDITSKSSNSSISIENDLDFEKVTYNYEILNNGPSDVKELRVVIPVPTNYLNNLAIVNLGESEISWKYDNIKLDVDMIDSKTDISTIYKSTEIEDQIVLNLPEIKTIHFNCSNTFITCTNVHINIQNFKSSNEPIVIKIKLAFNLKNIGKYIQ